MLLDLPLRDLDFDAASGCSSPSSMVVRMKNTFLHFEETILDGCSAAGLSPRVSLDDCTPGGSRSRSFSDACHLSPRIRSRLSSGVLQEIITNLTLAYSDSATDSNDFVMVMEESPLHNKQEPMSGLNDSQMGMLANLLLTSSPVTTPTPQSHDVPSIIIKTPEYETTRPHAQVTPDHLCTTVMLRNIPNKYTQKMLMDHVDERGFMNRYDFLYLPIDFRNKCNVGYAFINFVDNTALQDFKGLFDGYKLPGFNSQKVCQVTYARVQGLEANVEHYKNSPVCDVTVPEYRPIVLEVQR